MKKKFIAKTKQNKSYKFLFVMLLIFLIIIIYKTERSIQVNIKNKEILKLLLDKNTYKTKTKIIRKKLNKKYNLTSIIDINYKNLVKTQPSKIKKESKIEPIIYIYNTHQTEEYTPSNYAEYSVRPTVSIADYIIQDYFNKNNYKTTIEKRSTKDILNINKWNYAYSYKASRILLEDAKNNNSNLKYFIDIHRDSLRKNKTTININNKNYAKIVFIIGLENNNYKENLKFVSSINNSLNKNYPGLSKGIYKKGGEGVNGVYNQDFSPKTILVEIGGPDNTVDEVLNTSIAFSKCFVEVISKNES